MVPGGSPVSALSREDRVFVEVAKARHGLTAAAVDAAIARGRTEYVSLVDALVLEKALKPDDVSAIKRAVRMLTYLCAKCGATDYRAPGAPLTQGEFCEACRGAQGRTGTTRVTPLGPTVREPERPRTASGRVPARDVGEQATVRLDPRAVAAALRAAKPDATPPGPLPAPPKPPPKAPPPRDDVSDFADNADAAIAASAPSARPRLHLSGGATIDLEVGRTFTVGRAPGNSYVVPSSKVSRKHAEIRWKGGAAILVDLGSANGSFVNGKAISEHRLVSGDEIELGQFLFGSYRVERDGPGEKKGPLDATQKIAGGELLAGRLDATAVASVLQSIEASKKTGKLEVSGPPGVGWLTVKEGVPHAAELGAAKGEEAVIALLAMTSGRFAFDPAGAPGERRMKASIKGLLAEAAHRRNKATHVDG
jgi:pSer/pThr/pTyr-binding forkhead associated (FHA) protein